MTWPSSPYLLVPLSPPNWYRVVQDSGVLFCEIPLNLFQSMCIWALIPIRTWQFLICCNSPCCFVSLSLLFQTVLYYIGCVLSVGGLWLVCHWKPAWRVVLTASKCRIQQADCVVFKVCCSRTPRDIHFARFSLVVSCVQLMAVWLLYGEAFSSLCCTGLCCYF